MNKLDQNLQSLCPTVMVPRFEQLQPLDANGHRFLAAGDGLWIEVKRSWLNARMPIASSSLRLPYGMVEPVVDFRFGRGLLPLLERFALEARAAFPDEHAAWLVWNEVTQQLEYESVEVIQQGVANISYDRPRFSPGRAPCVDLHSHGAFEAYFSDTDNTDDDDTKLAICIGNCDEPAPTIAARLCLQGAYTDLSEWLSRLLADSGTLPPIFSNKHPMQCHTKKKLIY